MQKVDAEIRAIIDQQYAVARKLIEDSRDKMEIMASALLEWETLDAEQIDDTAVLRMIPAERRRRRRLLRLRPDQRRISSSLGRAGCTAFLS